MQPTARALNGSTHFGPHLPMLPLRGHSELLHQGLLLRHLLLVLLLPPLLVLARPLQPLPPPGLGGGVSGVLAGADIAAALQPVGAAGSKAVC